MSSLKELTSTFSSAVGHMAHSHRFHRLGLIFAMIVGVAGLVVIARDAVILRLWNVKYGELPIVLAGALIGLVEVAVVCCAAYGLVRALGWLVGRFRH